MQHRPKRLIRGGNRPQIKLHPRNSAHYKRFERMQFKLIVGVVRVWYYSKLGVTKMAVRLYILSFWRLMPNVGHQAKLPWQQSNQ